jgi:hypothetical protein
LLFLTYFSFLGLLFFLLLVKGKGKGKAVPLQAWSGPEGSRKLRFVDFLTTAQKMGKVVSLSSPVTGLEWPRWFQEVKVPRFLDNGTGLR